MPTFRQAISYHSIHCLYTTLLPVLVNIISFKVIKIVKGDRSPQLLGKLNYGCGLSASTIDLTLAVNALTSLDK